MRCALMLLWAVLCLGGKTMRYRTETIYTSTGCSGTYKTRVTLAAGICLPAISGTSTSYQREAITGVAGTSVTWTLSSFSGRSCQGTPTLVSTTTDASLTNYAMCINNDNGGSTSVVYTSVAPAYVDQGVSWTGYPTSNLCETRSSPSFLNFTAASACMPYGTNNYIAFDCDNDSLQKRVYSSATCTASTLLSSSDDFTTDITTASCTNVNQDLVDSAGGADRYVRPSCVFAPSKLTPVPVPADGATMYLLRLYHPNKACSSRTIPPFYRVEPITINTCNPRRDPVEPSQYKFTCKAGANSLTVNKVLYAATGCADSGVTSSRIAYHAKSCDRATGGAQGISAYHIETICGALPNNLATADTLLLKEFSDASCTVTPATKGVILGSCVPVFGPADPQTKESPVVYYRKLTFVSVTGSVTRIQEQRFILEDSSCSGAVIQSAILQFTDGVCQTDPLGISTPGSEGGFIGRVTRVQGGPSTSVPSWFSSSSV